MTIPIFGEPFLSFVTPSSTPTPSASGTPSGTPALACQPSDYRLLPHSDLDGEVIRMLVAVGFERDCQLACCAASSVYTARDSGSNATAAIVGCTAYSYIRTTRECFLLANTTAYAPNHQTHSGVLWASVPPGTTPVGAGGGGAS